MHFFVGGRREIERGITIMTPYVVCMSRSPAVALGIADVLGSDARHIEEETQPNPYVRELVRGVGEGFIKSQPAGDWFAGAV